MSDLVIFGMGAIAELAHYYFTHDSKYHVVGFTVDRAYLTKETFKGLPVVDFKELEKKFPTSTCHLFIALSYSHLNQDRAKKYHEAKAKGYRLASYVSSHATLLTEVVGDNCFILEDNTIQPYVKIGSNVTLWSGNHIGHHSVIDDHVFVSSHVVISGQVHICPYSFLGINASVSNNVEIAENTVVGAGAIILKNTEPGGVYQAPQSKLRKGRSSALKFFS